MRELYKAGCEVTLIDPMGLADDALVAVLSNMGAPLVGQERLADPDFATKPLRAMEDYLGRKFDAVMSLEIGGGNGVHPLMVAAMTGYPVVDADTMGRAYPEAQMTSVAVAGLQCYPLALADIRNNEVIAPRAASWKWMERISRKACAEVGSIASTCKAPRTGREVKDHGILYTTTQAINLGRAVMEARRVHTDPVRPSSKRERDFASSMAKWSMSSAAQPRGFAGSGPDRRADRDAGAVFTVHFRNEFSVGYRGNAPVVMTPDLICVVDSVSGDGIGTDVIRYGQRVSVLALPSPKVFLSPQGLSMSAARFRFRS